MNDKYSLKLRHTEGRLNRYNIAICAVCNSMTIFEQIQLKTLSMQTLELII
jgi:hypothetical protein